MASTRPALEQIKSRLTLLRSQPSCFSGTVYRSCTPRYANETDLLAGEGSRSFGGRWNPIGVAAVYASLTPETAMAESLAHYRYYGMPIEEAMPRVFVGIATRLQAILDLRQGSVRRRIQVSLERIAASDWRADVAAGHRPITQTIGEAACGLGWEGMLVPSSADPNGHNLLVFPQNLRAGSELRILHADQLLP